MDDKEILNLFFNRSEEAITETIKKYGNYCMKIALNILNNVSDSEECLNDTWLGLWNSVPPEKPDPLKVYIGRICRNISLKKYKYNNAAKRNKEMNLILTEIDEYIPGCAEYDDYEFDRIIELINEFLLLLSKENRIIFIRRYWYADKIKEIAETLNISENNVKGKLYKTRNKLKNHLIKKGVNIWNKVILK